MFIVRAENLLKLELEHTHTYTRTMWGTVRFSRFFFVAFRGKPQSFAQIAKFD